MGGGRDDLLTSLRIKEVIIYMEQNHKTTCIPHHLLYSISDKHCTNFKLLFSGRISLGSPFSVFFYIKSHLRRVDKATAPLEKPSQLLGYDDSASFIAFQSPLTCMPDKFF